MEHSGTDDWMQQLIAQQQQKQNLGVLEEEAKLRRKSYNQNQLEKGAHQNWLRNNGAIILAESLGWKNKMRHPPVSLDTCAEHQQNCFIDDELNEERWDRIGLAVFHYNRAPPFTDWMMNYWKKKDRFIGTMKNFRNLTHDWKKHDFPWALLAFESPQFHKSNLNFENYFIKRGLYNFTMTYRLDSDIPNPFGTVWMVKINYKNNLLKNLQSQREKSNFADLEVETRYDNVKNADPHDLFKIIPGRKVVQEKTKGVLVVVSNCDSKYRNSLLHLLSKHIKWPDGSPAIDMYGKCGERYDPNKRQRNTKKLSTEDFEKMLPEYRFYLAIENSRCTDYITEKFWRTLLNEVVPIAGGPAREDYEKLIDGDAFLHVADESDIYKTIAVVNKLLVDDLSYSEFFRWRNRDGPFGYKYGSFEEHTTRFEKNARFYLVFFKLFLLIHSPTTRNTHSFIPTFSAIPHNPIMFIIGRRSLPPPIIRINSSLARNIIPISNIISILWYFLCGSLTGVITLTRRFHAFISFSIESSVLADFCTVSPRVLIFVEFQTV